MKLLIAGAGGQLGRSLVRALAGHDVVGLARAELDVTDLEQARATLAALRPDVIVNAAAYNAVDAAESDSETAFAVNEAGPRNLAVASGESGALLLHVSTDYVFDGLAREPYAEDARPHPLSVYGRSKLAGEEAVRSLNPRHLIVRTAWLYEAQGRNFARTLLALARTGPVRVVDDQRGSPTYAPHLAQGIRRLLESGAGFGTYHLAGSGEATWYELARALFDRLAPEADLSPVSSRDFPRPAPRPAYSVLTSAREPRIVLPHWREGLAAFAEALLAAGETAALP